MEITYSDSKYGITAHLEGGLGNQLFILAAGLEQARRLGCPLFLDLDNYRRQNDRTFALDGLQLENVYILPENKSANLGLPSKVWTRISRTDRTHVELNKKYAAEIDRIHVGTHLVGFFQSPFYFKSVFDEILSNLATFDIHEKYPENQINIHLRRGDYTLPGNADHYGLVSKGYIHQSLEVIRTLTNMRKTIVFSDSPELVVETLPKQVEYTLDSPKGVKNRPLDLLSRMSSGTGFVMSNSTLSWWAAHLMNWKSPGALVVAPKPWYLKEAYDPALMSPRWLELPMQS